MIVNADDLGFSDDRNVAVVRALDEGFISSATLMATRVAFDGACELVRSSRLERHVGLHLVLTEDEPLTDEMRRCRTFCDAQGRFHAQLSLGSRPLTAAAELALAREMRAQIERCRAENIPLTHLDSHHHAHTDPRVIGSIITVAREAAIPFVRLARNCDPRTRVARKLIHSHVNNRIRRAGLARTHWFGRVEDYEALRTRRGRDHDDIEVMVHPMLSDDGRLMDTGGEVLAAYVARLGPVSLVSYAGEPARERRITSA